MAGDFSTRINRRRQLRKEPLESPISLNPKIRPPWCLNPSKAHTFRQSCRDWKGRLRWCVELSMGCNHIYTPTPRIKQTNKQCCKWDLCQSDSRFYTPNSLSLHPRFTVFTPTKKAHSFGWAYRIAKTETTYF